MEYITAIDLLSIGTLLVLAILVHENNRLDSASKRRFYSTYIIIFIALAAEWLSIKLNGTSERTRDIHLVFKCLDYAITPICSVCFVSQVSKQSRGYKFMRYVLIANVVLQVVSIFTGWTFYLDEANFYHHGPLYPVYAAIYIIAIFVVIWEFGNYGKKFNRQNRGSLTAILILAIAGILIQEIFGLRTCYITLSIGSVLLFIHYSEFSQLKSDADLTQQKALLEIDSLTGLYSRYAYAVTIHEYEKLDTLPDDLVVVSMDLNELKRTNDRLGHHAGDELIKGAAQCILSTLGRYGRCFRTGGDEFVALLQMKDDLIPAALEELQKACASWRGMIVQCPAISKGFATHADNPSFTINGLVDAADAEMYRDKNLYYQQPGKDRRTR